MRPKSSPMPPSVAHSCKNQLPRRANQDSGLSGADTSAVGSVEGAALTGPAGTDSLNSLKRREVVGGGERERPGRLPPGLGAESCTYAWP